MDNVNIGFDWFSPSIFDLNLGKRTELNTPERIGRGAFLDI